MSRALLCSVSTMANPTLLAIATVMLVMPSPKQLTAGDPAFDRAVAWSSRHGRQEAVVSAGGLCTLLALRGFLTL